MEGRLSKFDITKELPDYTQAISRRLYRVLEEIGASIALRDVRMKTCTTNEIQFSVSHSTTVRPLDVSYYIFGSLFEGSTTPGLKSDIDIVYVDEDVPVVTNIAESLQYEDCCLLIRDSNTPPGYTKLQYVKNGMPLYRIMLLDIGIAGPYIDEEDRFVLTLPRKSSSVLTRHGPAESSKATKWSLARDFVQAYRTRTWPDCALGWLTRPRLHNWPSQEQINKCKSLGCFFVYVGHPCSSENQLQWRISFSLQERVLVTNFNSVQLKCFILLKMIKKEKIHKKLGKKSLTSYHFKTCMLYMIENTPAEFWKEENLLICVHHCLGQMLDCVERGECPNYFIPEENMFEGRIFKQTQNKLCKLLRRMLCADFKFLLGIKSDKLGRKLQETLVPRMVSSRYRQAADMHSVQSGCIYNIFEILLTSRNRIYRRCQDTRIPFSALELYQIKCMLLQTDRVSEHSPTETREALSLLLPYADIALMSVLIVAAKRMSNSNEFVLCLLSSEKWHAVTLESDLSSSKLKQASLLYMLGYCQFSLSILQGLEDQIGQQILSLCNCTTVCNPRHLGEYWPVIQESGTFEEFLRHHMIPCVVYLPAEKDLTPPALCLEMDRAAGVPPNRKESYYNWAVVDGKVLLYFLLYLNHHHLNMEANAEADLDNIWWVVETDHLLRHKETAYNILGWIYKERGDIDEAVKCFQESLAVKRTCNAAHLHLQSMAT